jgi:hypothetical protein
MMPAAVTSVARVPLGHLPVGRRCQAKAARQIRPKESGVRVIRVRILDHVESTAVRPETVLKIDIPSRAP